ncbi:MAG: FTR1 family protein [Beijerinckiaceae bacterium]|nr:FTR1 family protein [Beijerinckiaceae bacterium]MCI0736107.1 FTR1 family protein [Beijerinckiaceae bacterium]
MAGAFIIIMREVIEAGLIIGIMLAVTRGLPSRGLYISAGILAGLFGAALVAIFAGALSNALAGAGQEVFNAAALGVAVIMLGWHNVWMARHGRQISKDLHRLGHDVTLGARPMAALAIVVAVAVLREGSEVVLFLYGVVIASRESSVGLMLGGLLGLLLGAGISALTYRGLVIIPPRYLFRITSVLIGLMAAGMAAQSVAFLEQANIVTRLGDAVWNTSWLLADNSIAGRVLHTLVGYTGNPTQLQLVVYLATLGTIFGLMKRFAPPAEHNCKLVTN